MQLKSIGLAVIAAHAVVLSAWAHHSHGAYAMTEYTQVAGTVTDVYWINPHAWVYIDVVEDSGQTVSWALEAAGATTLVRGGIDPDGVKAGDTISVRCHPLRDGSNGCLLGYVTTEDGVEIEWD
jgi:hypothetical protein